MLVFHNVTKGCSEVNGSLFYQVTSNRTRNGLKLSEGKFRLDNREKFVYRRCFQTLEKVSQQSGGVTISRGI